LVVAFQNSGRVPYACTGPRARILRGTLLVTPATPRITPTPERPCGVTGSPSGYKHVVWIVMENKRYDQIIGSSSAPYINDLSRRCGTASNFFAESHPSLPNYIAMTSGDTQGIKDDSGPSSHKLQVPSIFSQLGGDWRALQESMPSNCSLGNSGLYAVRHNPAAYYVNIRSQCVTQNVPLGGTLDLSARFTFITPNVCNDMHSCPDASDSAAQIRNGDTWLSTWMPKILDSPEYRSGSTVVFLTWDEDDYSSANKQHIATLVIAPSTPVGTAASDRFDHYSMLRTTEELLGLDLLGKASSAPSMRAAFHL